ncbi:DUF4286 family protein [Caldimonas taiwanensis]|uniref:DUF4286 family protein n=1 Tax=Caldimonas taiwanensis TaxID=307483 RepID=UPI000A61071D|nr:DUF4286 family protein [Caldimonas taiwanensis]
MDESLDESVWLLRFHCGADDAVLAELHALAPSLVLCRALEGHEVYAYADSEREVCSLMSHPLTASAESTRLRVTLRLDGASKGQVAAWRYVVETDVLSEAEADLNAWYDHEHLPGLAAVPGTVRAQRLLNEQGHPRYHACYDLVTLETFGSPAWLAVRATAWSSRVRPSFRNTRRTMFRRI